MASKRSDLTTITTSSADEQKLLIAVSNRIERLPRPAIVALAGGSCCGKSTVSGLLERHYSGNIVIFPLDDFQLGEDFKQKSTSPYRWDDPANFDPVGASEALRSLITQGRVEAPRFNLPLNRREGSIVRTIAPLVVVEGLYPLSLPMRDLIQFGIYFEAPFFARFLRRIVRFVASQGTDRAPTPIRHMLTNVWLAHRKFVAPQRDSAELVIRVDYDFAKETRPLIETLRAPGSRGVRKEQLDEVQLPQGITLASLLTDRGEFLRISHGGAPLIELPTDPGTAQRLQGVDWESY